MPSPKDSVGQEATTVVTVETDELVAMEMDDGEIENHEEKQSNGVTINFTDSVPPDSFGQFVVVKKESPEEVIEVDVELDGDNPPLDFFPVDPTEMEDGQDEQIGNSMESRGQDQTGEDGVDVICGKCGKRFHDISSLQWHLKLHSKIKDAIATSTNNRYSKIKNYLQCPECELSFSKQNELLKHVHAFHSDTLQEIHELNAMSTDNGKGENLESLETDFSSFNEDENNDDVYEQNTECENCSENFLTAESLAHHLQMTSCGISRDDGMDSSKIRFSPKNSLIVSLKDICLKSRTCQVCGKVFTSSGSLKRHLSTDHKQSNNGDTANINDSDEEVDVLDIEDEKPLIIQIIKEANGEHFENSEGASLTEFSEFDKKAFTCQECGEEFSTSFNLTRHMRSNHYDAKVELFICKKCGKSFDNEYDLEDHIEEHARKTRRKQFRCPDCGRTFTHKHSLKNHMPLHRGMGEHQCKECGKLFPCVSSLNRHIKIHSTSKPFFCPTCDKGFKDSYALKKHEKVHTSAKPYVCHECGTCFRTQSTLSAHTVVHTKLKPFPCKECGKNFSFRSDLNRHMKLHTGVRPHKCDICNKAFFENSRLVIHRRTHTGEKPFKCTECDEGFISSRNLARHMKCHNPTFICTDCGKTYVDAYTLKIHMFKHTGERPHACPQCPKKFRTPGLLKKHELTHTGVKPFVCEECGRGFTSALNLKNHTTLHTGNRPFQCPQCEKCFPTESTLKVHMQFHGEKGFFCEECGKSFHRVYELNLHAITHAAEKPFSCELCGKSFCHKATYKAHMNTHTEETKYNCLDCGKVFLRANTLRKHMKTHVKSKASTEKSETAVEQLQPQYYEEAYLCTQCNTTHPNAISLQNHFIEHHGDWKSTEDVEIEPDEETELIVEEVTECQ